jgi:hypothetical protein
MILAEAEWAGAVGTIGAAVVALTGVIWQGRKTRRQNTEEHDRNKAATVDALADVAGKVDGVAGQIVDVAGQLGAVGARVDIVDGRLGAHLAEHAKKEQEQPVTPVTQ